MLGATKSLSFLEGEGEEILGGEELGGFCGI